jgi:hypothetical protein
MCPCSLCCVFSLAILAYCVLKESSQVGMFTSSMSVLSIDISLEVAKISSIGLKKWVIQRTVFRADVNSLTDT